MFTAITGRRRRSEREGAMLIDEVLPEYDATVHRHAVVEASVETTYEAVTSADLAASGPIVRALTELRFLPRRIEAALQGEPQPATRSSARLGDLRSEGIWVRLDEVTGEEFVFGAIGRVWKPTIEWVEIDARDFAAFDRPGYAKIAAGISVRPYGPDRTIVTYEARTLATDDAARRRFLRYWRLVGPFAGLMMRMALRTMKADAERSVGDR